MLAYKDARELAINILDRNFKSAKKDPFLIGLATGKALAFQTLDVISYEEYNYYVDALLDGIVVKCDMFKIIKRM